MPGPISYLVKRVTNKVCPGKDYEPTVGHNPCTDFDLENGENQDLRSYDQSLLGSECVSSQQEHLIIRPPQRYMKHLGIAAHQDFL